MCTDYDSDDDMLDTIHDCLVMLDIEPTEEKIAKIKNTLPDDILSEAVGWGWNDTLVKEKVYFYIDSVMNTTNEHN